MFTHTYVLSTLFPDFAAMLDCIELIGDASRNLKNRAPVEAKRYFLQNRRFRFKFKHRSKKHRNLEPTIDEKLIKIDVENANEQKHAPREPQETQNEAYKHPKTAKMRPQGVPREIK